MQKRKFEQYQEFLAALSGIVGTDSTPDANRRFATSCNTLVLMASAGVLRALQAFQAEISVSNVNKSTQRHDELLSKLVWEIREDLGIRTPDVNQFSVGLWCSGANPATRPERDSG